jgi:hypothetical protein
VRVFSVSSKTNEIRFYLQRVVEKQPDYLSSRLSGTPTASLAQQQCRLYGVILGF